MLKGRNGTYTYDRTATGGMNPAGTTRRTPAVNGSTVHLTISQDLQFVVQRDLDAAVKRLRAVSGNVVVLDVKNAQVLAMAGSETENFNSQDPSTYNAQHSSDSAIQVPYEPGSVNKVVTFSAALQKKIIKPMTALTVPDHLHMGDVTIHDDWYHPPLKLTATGILAKSSNIGTLKIAQKVGPATFMDYAKAYGIGQKTGIELPGESAGILPARSTWSASTFANLPIGQGLSVTPLQLASIYQTIANNGVRIPPRIVSEVTGPDGSVQVTKQPAGIRVTSVATAKTLRTMLESVMLPGGTGQGSAMPGFRIAGKTGTAQQPDPQDRPVQQQRVLGLLRGHRARRQPAVRRRGDDQRAGRRPVRSADRGPAVPRHRHLRGAARRHRAVGFDVEVRAAPSQVTCVTCRPPSGQCNSAVRARTRSPIRLCTCA